MFKINFKKYLILVVFSLPNTFLTMGLLYIINTFLTEDIENFPGYLIPIYFSIILYSYLLNIFFQTKLVNLNYSMIYESEVKILKILHKTTLIKFEKYGAERFYANLEDLRVFIYLPTILINIINSLLTLSICLGYLFWISPRTTLFLTGFIILIVALYFFVNKRLAKKYESLRILNEDYYRYVDDSIKGFKELKISAIKNKIFFNKYLKINRKQAEKLDTNLTNKYLMINLISQNGIYIILGIVLFILVYFKTLNQKEIITYVAALLFLNGPINSLVASQDFITKAIISNKRIKKFFNDFKSEESNDETQQTGNLNYKKLLFKDISFSYNTNEKEVFALKDINLEIKRGEVLFIVGGNGSGKSTFINVLTGLYPPNGQILLNGKEVDNFKTSYRNLFSVIYTNNHIFSKNYDEYSLEGNEYYHELLKMMKMDTIIHDDNDESVRRKFSKGQSKRMSMIFALLENKPILVLDEWAADQDPYFRKYFYEELIPILRNEGKTIIAVTHDDAYFKYANRVVKFDYGRIVEDSIVTNKT